MIAKLREMLGNAPSGDNFKQIVELFEDEQQRANPELPVALGYAESHMAEWPNSLRRWHPHFLPPSLDHACLELFRRLDVYGTSHEQVATLVQSPRVSNLTDLWVFNHAPAYDITHVATAISNSPHMSNLTSLALWGAYGVLRQVLRTDAMRAIAGSKHLSHLRDLDIRDNGFYDSHIQVIAESPHMANLESLNLRGSRGNITSEALACIEESPHLRNLKFLHLDSYLQYSDGARLLRQSPRTSQELKNHLETQW